MLLHIHKLDDTSLDKPKLLRQIQALLKSSYFDQKIKLFIDSLENQIIERIKKSERKLFV